MKKYLMLTLALLFSMQMLVTAQNQRNGQRVQQTPKERAERLAKQLELTAEQQTQVEALFVKQDADRTKWREEMRANNQGAGFDREKMRAQFDERRKAENEALEKIIGKEKMEKYLKWQEEMRQQVSKTEIRINTVLKSISLNFDRDFFIPVLEFGFPL
jgi:Spy/CpxP family protein refolding chaperone